MGSSCRSARNGATSLFERDRHHRLLSSTDPLGRTVGVTYDADGSVTGYAYDAFGRPVAITDRSAGRPG
ncbi:RHS repeat domain-containing protein [Streptomyces sp. NPDC003860]